MFTRAEIRKAVWDEHVVNDRTTLADRLKAWFDKKTTHIGLQYVDLGADGNLKKGRYIEREDVACFQSWNRANVFLHFDRDGGPDWNISIQTWHDQDDRDVTDRDQRLWEAEVAQWIEANAEFVAHQRKWFAEKPYESIIGMTPRDGAKWLIDNGWKEREWKMAPPPESRHKQKPIVLVDEALELVFKIHSSIYDPDDTRPAEPMLASLEHILRELRTKPAIRR